MSGNARLPRRLRDDVARAAGHRCGYCRTPESIAGFRLSIHRSSEPAGIGGGSLALGASGLVAATRVIGNPHNTYAADSKIGDLLL